MAGDYHYINVTPDDDSYKAIGCCGPGWTVTVQPIERGFHALWVAEADDEGRTYYPDEEAYPVTYRAGWYRGSPEQIERYQALEYSEDFRIVPVGTRIFVLRDYDGPHDYEIDTVLEPGRMKGLKGVIQSFKVAISNPGPDLHAELQAYLDAGFARQAELLPAWTAANGHIEADRQARHDAITAEIDGRNSEYFASQEYQDVLKARELAAESARNMVTVRNDTDTEFRMVTSFTSYPVSPGYTTSWACSMGEVFLAVGGPDHWDKGTLLFDTNDRCGTEILVSEL